MAGLLLARAAIGGEALPDPETAPPPSTGAAPDPAQNKAREEFEAGVTALREGRLADAERSFRASLSSARRASALYNLALTLLKQGRYRESIRSAQEVASDPSLSADARHREEAEALVRRASASFATLRVSVRPTSALVRVDGERAQEAGAERSIALDPGRHLLEVSAPGHLAVQHGVVLQKGTEFALVVSLTPLPPPSPAPTPDSGPRKALRWRRGSSWASAARSWQAGSSRASSPCKRTTNSSRDARRWMNAIRASRTRGIAQGRSVVPPTCCYVTGGAVAAAGLVWHFILPSPSAPGRATLSVTGRF